MWNRIDQKLMEDGVFDTMPGFGIPALMNPTQPNGPAGPKKHAGRPNTALTAPAFKAEYDDDTDEYEQDERGNWSRFQGMTGQMHIPGPQRPSKTGFNPRDEPAVKGILRSKNGGPPLNSADLLQIQEQEFARRANQLRKNPFDLGPRLHDALKVEFGQRKDYHDVEARAALIMKENLEKKKRMQPSSCGRV